MRCKKAKILISAALDGELSAKEGLALERHMCLCAECAREKTELAGLRATMSSWSDESPSERLAGRFALGLQRIMQEKRAAEPKPKWRFGVLGPAAAGLAVAALLIVMLVHNRAPLPTPTVVVKPRVVTTAPDHQKQIAQGNETTGPPGRMHASDHQGRRRIHVAGAREKPPVTTPAAPPSTGPGAGAIIAETPVSGVAPSAAADQVKYNLGEAGIAMNETMEKLRGTLQEAVDLVVSKPPVPVVEPTGGNVP